MHWIISSNLTETEQFRKTDVEELWKYNHSLPGHSSKDFFGFFVQVLFWLSIHPSTGDTW